MTLDIMSLSEIFQNDSDDLDDFSIDIIRAIERGIQSFACSKSSYHEDFLKNKAKEHSLHNTSRTYVMIDRDAIYNYIDTGNGAERMIGAYFTIGISSISLADEKMSSKKVKRLRSHTFIRDNTMGCFVIGELCRSDYYSSSELTGLEILDSCLGIIRNAQNIVGGRIVLVDSRKKVLESLYSKRGFKELSLAGIRTTDGEKLLTSAVNL